MATLHKTIQETRIILKWGTIAVGAIIFFFVFLNVGKGAKELFFPTPPPPPTVFFGKLPKITFPKNAADNNFTYTLNTLSGKLPVFSDRAVIYKTIAFEPNLLALKNAQERLSRIGFLPPGTAITNTAYQWTSKDSKRIIFDILSLKFDLTSGYLSQENVLSAKKLPDEKGAQTFASGFLSNISLFPNDLDPSKTKTTIFVIKDSALVPATSLSNANVVRVDFFQKDVDKFPVFYPYPPNSIMNVFVASGEFEPQVVEAHFFHQDLSEKSATYPIKTAQEAFAELKNSKAYIASYFGKAEDILVRNVFLAYYVDENPKDYLMPIVVFEGDGGFFAYVSAVKESWIDQEQLDE